VFYLKIPTLDKIKESFPDSQNLGFQRGREATGRSHAQCGNAFELGDPFCEVDKFNTTFYPDRLFQSELASRMVSVGGFKMRLSHMLSRKWHALVGNLNAHFSCLMFYRMLWKVWQR